MKKTILFISITIFLLLLMEISLRLFWGFGTMPLYYVSDVYEYMQSPNQDMVRLGNHIHFNSYSQRSEEPDTNSKVILGLGDSVINGGVQTDNDSLATSIVSNDTDFQMLNISAGSWSADNLAAYLGEFGFFNAKAMIVYLSSHDAHDNMDFKPVVGVQESFPCQQYSTAISEVVLRYVWPRYLRKFFVKNRELDPDEAAVAGVGIDKGGEFNLGWSKLKQYSDSLNIPLVVVLHADQSEFKEKKYNTQGELIINWAKLNQVPLYKDIEVLDLESYRDGIHINPRGQKKIATLFKKIISENILSESIL